jgi:hypothetical protein
VERIYTLAYASQNPTFNSDSWRDMPAESMWNQGVSEIVEKAVPNSTRQLKEILNATVPGAHDKAASSETDVIDAAKYLGKLLGPLNLGGG